MCSPASLPVFTGRHSYFLPEHAAEIGPARETDLQRDFSQIRLARFQTRLCLTDPIPVEIGHQCHSCFLVETTGQVLFAYTNGMGYILQRDRLGRMLVDIGHG